MKPRLVKPMNRLITSGRGAIVAVALCAAVVGLLPAGASRAATTGADVVLVDLSVDRAAVGTPYSYLFEVDNRGPDAATEVGLTAVVHDISSFKSASSDQGTCSYLRSSNRVHCEIGELASGASATVEIVVEPEDHTDSTATISGATGEDPDTSNNRATSSPLVLAPGSADLWVYPNSGVDDTGFGSTGYAVPGEPFDYSIDVINYGPAIAKDVMLSVLLPFGVEFQSAEVACDVHSAEDASTLVTCRLGTIETARTVRLTAVAPLGAAGQTLRTEVVVDGSTPDPGPQPNDVSNYLTIAPGLSANDRPVSEGARFVDIPVDLYGSVDHQVTVDYATVDGSARAGKDYAAATGTLTFAPGQTTQSASVSLLSDRRTEADESFTLTLSKVNGAEPGAGAPATNGPPVTLVKPDAAIIILDNDPKVNLHNVRTKERNKRMTKARFTVKLSHTSPEAVSVRFATVGASARARSDFRPVKKIVTFLPGQIKQIVPIAVIGDRKKERTERFLGKLSKARGARLGDVKGIARILDND